MQDYVNFFSCSEELQVHLSHVPSVEELKKTLASRFIMTMATSPPDQPVVKMFFYAQHVRYIYELSIHLRSLICNIYYRSKCASVFLGFHFSLFPHGSDYCCSQCHVVFRAQV